MADKGSSEEPIETLSEFLESVKSIERHSDRFLTFRGQADANWEMLPSIMRGDKKLLDHEKDIMREIISRYPYDFDQDLTTFDRLSRMQHYGIATRLLDVTTNPLVALYFAIADLNDPFIEPHGCVMTLDAPLSRRKFFDSDTVSCISNLSSLAQDEKETLTNSTARTILEFNALKPAKRLLQFIKAEKPYFLPEIKREDLHTPYIVVPKLRNSRIIAQHGAFMIFGLDRNAGPTYTRNIATKKIHISASSKKKLREELQSLGISDATLFPEIDKASAHLMARLKA
jgi:hypothetical protein